MMVACVVLPILLFGFASWLNYRHEHAVADDRIERSLDILHEHTLKVFQTVERAIAEVDEIVRGMPDDALRQNQARLHDRLKQIVDALPQLRAIFLIDRDGRPIVSSQLAQVPPDFNVRDRDFFRAHVAGPAGTYVSDVMAPRLTGFGTPFFVLSRRRPSADSHGDRRPDQEPDSREAGGQVSRGGRLQAARFRPAEAGPYDSGSDRNHGPKACQKPKR